MKKSNDSKANSGPPSDVPPPPNIIDPSKAGPTYTDLEKGKEKRKKKGRNHPTDSYNPMKKKGCGGCCGCLGGSAAVIVLVLVGVIGWFGFSGPGRFFMQDDFEKVALKDETTTISEAPENPTLYIGNSVIYDVRETEVPIAIIGTDVTVSGDFLEDVSLTGAKVTATEGSRFAGDLEVWGAEFYDKGLILNGELKGGVAKSLD